jgi:hypothetical protein
MKATQSMAFEQLSGKSGSVVIADTKSGLIIRPRTRPKNPKTPAQESVRLHLSTSATLFKNMTPTQLLNWRTYASNLTRQNPVTGKKYAPAAMNVFTGLASKYLQVTPNGTVPMTPPTSDFTGDKPTVTALGGPGKVTFTADAANSTNVVTELLLQPLKSKNRLPSKGAYRTKQFVSFTSGSLSAVVAVPAGTYAAAYRFVNSATGQESPLVPISIQQVSFALEEGGKAGSKKAA